MGKPLVYRKKKVQMKVILQLQDWIFFLLTDSSASFFQHYGNKH